MARRSLGPVDRSPDDEATQRVLRSFLIVRIVRGSLLLVFWVVALIGVRADGWPTVVAVAVCVAGVVQAALLVGHWRRLTRVNLTLRH